MCGRFTLRTPANVLIEHFALRTAAELRPRYNIAPTQDVVAVRLAAEDETSTAAAREMVTLRWGLIPSWAKDPSIGNHMINARGETAAAKPAFRAAFKRRRCLVAADGYYEWQKIGRRKQPFYIHRRDGQPFAFAGLWERWSGGDARQAAAPLQTCTIITTTPSELMRPIHDRLPVIVAPTDYQRWLDPDADSQQPIETLLTPFESDLMVADPVDTYVNNPKNDGPQCVKVQRTLF